MRVARGIGQFSPFGPVVAGELRSASRRARNHLLRLLYLGSLLLVMLVAASQQAGLAGQSMMYRVQAQQQTAVRFGLAFAEFSIIAMALVAPILTSTAISADRRRKTLDLLLMTPINSWQIVSGKLFSRLLTAVTLLALSLPVLAIIRLLGSLELDAIAGVLCLAVSTAVLCGAVGLWFSARLERTSNIILSAYGVLALWYLFVPFIIRAPSYNANGAAPRVVIWALCVFQPMIEATVVLDTPPGVGAMSGIQPWWQCAMAQLILAGLLLASTARSVRIAASPADREHHHGSGGRRLAGIRLFLLPLSTGRGGKRRPRRSVGDHPVLWRELRTGLLANRWQRVAATLAVLAILGLAVGVSDWGRSYFATQGNFADAFLSVAGVLVVVLSATSIAHEKESQTWPLLLASPLGGLQIVGAKAVGIARRLLWPALLMAVYFLLIGPGLAWLQYHGRVWPASGLRSPGFAPRPISMRHESSGIASGLLSVWIILTFCSLWAAFGLAMSLRFARATTAVIASLLTGLCVYALPPVLVSIFNWHFPNGTWLTTPLFEPYYCIARVFEWDGYDRTPNAFDTLRVHIAGPTTFDAPLVWTLVWVGIAHLLIAAGIFCWTCFRFDHHVGRAPCRKFRITWRPQAIHSTG